MKFKGNSKLKKMFNPTSETIVSWQNFPGRAPASVSESCRCICNEANRFMMSFPGNCYYRTLPKRGASANDFWFFSTGDGWINTAKKAMMFDTFFPEILAMVTLVKIELHGVLVVSLQYKMSCKMILGR